MTLPELDDFRRRIETLRQHSALKPWMDGDRVALGGLTLPQIVGLLADDAGYYFLIAAAGLNRTTLRRGMSDPEAQVVAPVQRRAYVVRTTLPTTGSFDAVASSAVSLRQGDLQRKARGQIEQVFRDRLIEEEVPLFMSPPVRQVHGVVIAKRKPDGIWPDPATGQPPRVYLEIKNIRRVADDIQKRLYELAEASLEMKLLYGNLAIRGLGITMPAAVREEGTPRALRAQIAGHPPIVIGLLICARAEAKRYRPGAEAFVDRIFFQEEIGECISFIRDTIIALS